MFLSLTNRQVKINHLSAFIALLILVLIKVPYLALPFYWDEAWSYAKAVNEMNTHTITLLPSHVNQEVFRGHPLFFYFYTSGFARIFSFTPVAMHWWMLATSVTCLGFFYNLVQKLYNSSIALLALVFLVVQEVVIVQSSFLLPEIMIAFLSFFAMAYSIRNAYVPYLIAGCLLVLTKESGIIAILAICFHAFILMLIQRNFTIESIKRIFILSLPLWLFGLFILWQKLTWGWFLFPDHTALMDFSKAMILGKLNAFWEFVWYQQHRKFYTILFLFALPILFVTKRNSFMTMVKDSRLYLLLSFVLFYAIFSSVNFYSARYLLAFLPVFALVSALIIIEIIDLNVFRLAFTVFVALYFLGNYFLDPTTDFGDTSKNYVNVVISQKKCFDEFINRHPNSTFGGEFLTNENLQHHEMGYLAKDIHIVNKPIEEAEFIVSTCIEPIQERIDNLMKDSSIQLVYENNITPAWTKVYQRKK